MRTIEPSGKCSLEQGERWMDRLKFVLIPHSSRPVTPQRLLGVSLRPRGAQASWVAFSAFVQAGAWLGVSLCRRVVGSELLRLKAGVTKREENGNLQRDWGGPRGVIAKWETGLEGQKGGISKVAKGSGIICAIDFCVKVRA